MDMQGNFGINIMLCSFVSRTSTEPSINSTICCDVVTRGLTYAIRAAVVTSSPFLFNDDPSYADVEFFISFAGVDWRFVVSLDKENCNIYNGCTEKSTSENEPFGSTSTFPPSEVDQAYIVIRPIAVNLLNNILLPSRH